jgi:hypothetical protein
MNLEAVHLQEDLLVLSVEGSRQDPQWAASVDLDLGPHRQWDLEGHLGRTGFVSGLYVVVVL